MPSNTPPLTFSRAAALLGFALGGFFDGILLHQILQWHHLLSALEGRDARFQVAADGYFHAFMYVLAAAGLWGLWREGARTTIGGGQLLGSLLIGFGLWQVVDIGLAHWVLGIHRVRVDVHNPLAWDLGWLAVFGILPLAAGLMLRRGRIGGGGRPAAAMAALFVLGAGAWASRPVSPFTTVLFAPGTSESQVMAAIAAVDAQLMWLDGSGEVAVITRPARSGWALYGQRAILVGGAGAPDGCFSWSKA